MRHSAYMGILRLDEHELRSRRAFFQIQDADLARLASLREVAEKWMDGIVDSFYELMLAHPETRTFLPNTATVERVKKTQREYFRGLFVGRCDAAYVEDRLRVGATHERIGLAPKWYLGAYRLYLQLLHDRMFADLAHDEAHAAFESVLKLVSFDEALAIDTYIAANVDTLGRQQAAIRELSTPVIRVHDRVLLLPIVGGIDDARATQIMDSVLTRVIEEQARCMIVDIAGVPVVDTHVADILVKTAAAVSLLGAKTILTGVSAPTARAFVHLGVDLSSLETSSQLADGIDAALRHVGRAVVAFEG